MKNKRTFFLYNTSSLQIKDFKIDSEEVFSRYNKIKTQISEIFQSRTWSDTKSMTLIRSGITI
jgi:hypothetical protein